jgi:hypothetical protein
MADDKDQEKTPVEDKEEEKEEDEFSDLFEDDEEEKEEASEEEEEKPQKKSKPVKQPRPQQDRRFEEFQQRAERREDVSDFLDSEEGEIFRKYKAELKKAAVDQRYINVPVNQLPQILLKPSAYTKILEDAKKKADEEADDSFNGGGGSRVNTTPKELQTLDPTTVSKEEFQNLVARAKRGEFKIKKQ